MDKLARAIYDWVSKNPALVISGLSLFVATLGFILTHFARIRSGWTRTVLAIGGWIGLPHARYRSSFLRAHRELHNIYLDRVEHLDVVATYVPLHVLSATDGPLNVAAVEVLLSAEEDRTVILGDPGSGKTTLLKAFGVSLISGGFDKYQRLKRFGGARGWRPRLTPIFVELRDFANRLGKYDTLAEYITEHVLKKHFSSPYGVTFFRQLLLDKQCVLLLDALDEVGTSEYERVRVAIHVFLSDHSEALPTANARVVLTSRYQNFLSVHADWIPSAFPRFYPLAPFSDEDIQQFLHKRAADLPPEKTPAGLLDEIRHSSTLDLHRIPLILTISLGLYKIIPRYTIPESIARFYEEVVRELLQRHDFRTRPYLPKRNTFPSEFKLQFLRELALVMAVRPGKFEEFSYEELSAVFVTISRRNARLSANDSEEFLKEIVDNAGMLRRISDDGTHVFAHRSFHEYMAALQLSKSAEQGADHLISRAEEPLWRQITVFFAAMDHDKHDQLLLGLVQRNPELAGYCLAVTASVAPDVALLVVQRLNSTASRGNAVSVLGALSAICRSTGEPVREQALVVIGRVLTQVLVLQETSALLGLVRDDLVSLARALAGTGASNVVGPCISLSRLAECDHRMVPPLWACLALFVANESAPEALHLVVRLLELVQTPEGLNALKESPLLSPTCASSAVRAFAYPFERAASRESNIVTLLAWAHCTNVLPDERNGFLKAFAERNSSVGEWLRIERELEKTPLSVRLFPLGLVLFWGGGAASVAYIFWAYMRQGEEAFAARHLFISPDSWHGWMAIVGVGYALGLLFGLSAELGLHTVLRATQYGSVPANRLLAFINRDVLFSAWFDHEGKYYWDIDTHLSLLCIAMAQVPIILVGSGLAAEEHLWIRVLLSAVFSLVCFWLPATYAFGSQTYFDLRNRGRLASLVMEDSSSTLWIQTP